MNVTVYTKNNCVQCKSTKRRLQDLGIEYQEINVEAPGNEALLDQLRQEGYRQMPVVKANNEVWSGFRPSNIQKLAS